MFHGRHLPRMVQLAAALLTVIALGSPAAPAAAATRNKTVVSKTTSVKKTPARASRKRVYSARAANARRLRLERARAAIRSGELREAQTPRFALDALGNQVPDIRAAAAIIYNPETNEVLWESHAKEQRSIASITKVMTALVVLESGQDLATPVIVDRSDVTRASTTYLRAGYQVQVEDLLNLLLIGSDNAAARALARVSPYGGAGFVARMNAKALELGLESTQYSDPSGLLSENVSSAYDMARLISYASADERLGSIMRKSHHTVQAGKQQIKVSSTNQLVKTGDLDVLGGKTGFISRSGYCLATIVRLPQTGKQVALVVLGAKSNAGRFWETRHLFNWIGTHTQRLLGATAAAQRQQDWERQQD